MDYVYHEPKHEEGDRRCEVDGCNLLDDEHAPELTIVRATTLDGSVEVFAFTSEDALDIILDAVGEGPGEGHMVLTKTITLGVVFDRRPRHQG